MKFLPCLLSSCSGCDSERTLFLLFGSTEEVEQSIEFPLVFFHLPEAFSGLLNFLYHQVLTVGVVRWAL